MRENVSLNEKSQQQTGSHVVYDCISFIQKNNSEISFFRV